MKTHFGHIQSAAGAPGLINAVLAVAHGAVPRNLHFTRLPDDLARVETKLFVPQQIKPWPANSLHPRRAAVSSYGPSGTNVHAISRQASEQASGAFAREQLSTKSSMTAPLLLPAYTLARRGGHRPVPTALVTGSRPKLSGALREVADGDAPYQAAEAYAETTG